MNRTAWLQERRMKKFIDVLVSYETRRVSGLEAAEMLEVLERTASDLLPDLSSFIS